MMGCTSRQIGLTALSAVLLAGVAACTATPRYPIEMGQKPGAGGLTPWQPRYPISPADAARNAADRASGSAIAPYGQAGVPAAAVPPPARSAPSPDDDAPHAAPNAPVDQSDLPPPSASPRASLDGGPATQTGTVARTVARAGLVFGLDPVLPPAERYAAVPDSGYVPSPQAGVQLAAYRRRRRKADAATEASDTQAAGKSASKTPYVTEVKPGEKLSDVASRLGVSKQSLIELNDLKHPRHLHAGAALKVPYRQAYQVQKGDTLYTISRRFSQDPDAVVKLNGLKHAAALQPGDTIQLPPDAKDVGPRDHAAGAAAPIAAPEKLIAAETRKLERAQSRRGRREQRAEAARAAAAPSPAPASDTPPPLTASTPPADSRAAASATAALNTRALRGSSGRHRQAAAVASETSSPSTGVSAPPPATSFASAGAGSVFPPSGATPSGTAPAAPTEVARGSFAAPAPAQAPVGTPSPASTAASVTQAALAPARPPAQVAATPSAALAAAPFVRPRAPVTAAPTTSAFASPAAGVAGYAAGARAPGSYVPSYPPGGGYAASTPSAAIGAPASTAAPTVTAPYAARAATAYAAPAGGMRVATANTPYGAYSPSLGRARAAEPALSGGVLTNSDITTAGRGRFIWPLRGAILSPFGDKGAGQHNDGVDIAVQTGSAVRAAAGGEVVYAGSSIPGFGNLVLVKHAGGWVTAYAHLDRIEVRMRDAVTQGQEIGQAGQSGAVDRPLLHFEVRYAAQPTEKARPIDPTLVLPAGG